MSQNPKLAVEITGDAQGLFTALGKAGEGVRDFQGRAGTSASGIGASFDGLFAGMQGGFAGIALAGGAAIAGATAAFGRLAWKGVEAAGALQDLSDKTSLSVEFLSAMGVAAADANVPVEALAKAFKGFSETMLEAQSGNEEATGKLRSVGIEISKIKDLGDEDAFRTVLQGLSRMGAGVAQTTAAVKIFGKSGMDMVALLSQTGGDLDKFMEKAKEAGLVYDSKTAKDADEVGDAFRKVGEVFEHLAVNVIKPALPALKDAAEALGKFAAGAKDSDVYIESLMATTQANGGTLIGFLAALADVGGGESRMRAMIMGRKMWEEANQRAIQQDQAATAAAAQKKTRDEEEQRRKEAEARKKAIEERKKNLADLVREARARLKEEAEVQKKAAEDGIKVASEEAQTKRNVRLIALQGEMKDLERRRNAGTITEREYLKAYYDFENERIEIQKAAVEARLAIEKNDPVAAAKLRGDMEELLALQRRLKLERQDALTAEGSKGDGGAGFSKGIDDWLAQSLNRFQMWQDAAKSVADGVANSFDGFYGRLIQGGAAASHAWRNLFQGMANSVTGALTKIMAQESAHWLLLKAKFIWSKIKSAWDTADTVKHVAESTTKSAANVGETSTNLTAAGSGIMKAHSGIPIVGMIIAAAAVLLMLNTMKSITARAVGGLVSGPQLTLLGERGPEVVAPEADFKDWAKGFASLGANIAQAQASERNYQMQSSRYAHQGAEAVGQGAAAPAPLQVDLRGAMFLGSEEETRRIFADMTHKALYDRDRRNA